MTRLSLVIATYNRAECLMVTLASVAEQSAKPQKWECIVVDNNSKDDTKQRVERFIANHPTLNVRYVFEVQQGLSYARNAGIAHADGDIVAFIDDDERIVPNFISSYISLFDEYPNAMVAGGKIVAEYPTGRPRWMSHFTELPIANPMDFGDYVCRFPKRRIPGGGNMAMRRELFERVGVFNTSLGRTGKSLIGGEESELFERIRDAKMECYYTPHAVMYHIIPAEKLTPEYFTRLSYNIGVSQRMRAELRGGKRMLYVRESIKWMVTLLLVLIHRPAQSRYLIKMRKHISRGIWSK